MNYSLYQLLCIFIFYAFAGWCTEVIFAATKTGHFVNRGFLNGPVCPIYGFGVLVVVSALQPFADSFLATFVFSVLITSALEFVTGFVLEKCFGDKWWDYSNEPFNIKGYICLRFSLLWGFACVLVTESVHPLVMKLIGIIPMIVGVILLCVFYAVLLSDFALTVAHMLKLKRRLARMEELGASYHRIGDLIGKPLAAGAIDMKSKIDDRKQQIDEKYGEELEQLTEKYRALAEKSSIVERRLLKAFPRLQSGLYTESINKLKQLWEEMRNNL